MCCFFISAGGTCSSYWHGAQSNFSSHNKGIKLRKMEIRRKIPLLPETRLWKQLGKWVRTYWYPYTVYLCIVLFYNILHSSVYAFIRLCIFVLFSVPYILALSCCIVLHSCYCSVVSAFTALSTRMQWKIWCGGRWNVAIALQEYLPWWAWQGVRVLEWAPMSPSVFESVIHIHLFLITWHGPMERER